MQRRTYLRLAAVGGSAVTGGIAGARHMVYPTEAQSDNSWTQQAKLTADDGDPHDGFGGPIALDGDTALIGAPYDNISHRDNAGSTYVFERSNDTWVQQTKLAPDSTNSDDQFGRRVALDGDTALIGVFRHDTPAGESAGSVYVFKRSGGAWTQQAKLTADDGGQGHMFGSSVALDDNTALIGAFRSDTPNSSWAGSAYVFERSDDGWTQRAKLYAPDSSSRDGFGASVALDGDTALIGAYEDNDPNGDQSGSAYVFRRATDTWTQQSKIVADDGDSYDRFGTSVDILDNTALIGAVGDDNVNGDGAGAAYIFERSTDNWRQQAKLTAAVENTLHGFGRPAVLTDDMALIGVFSYATGDRTGLVHLFDRSGGAWTQQAILAATDGDHGDRFGLSTAIDNGTILVGAPNDNNQHGNGAGSVYLFTSPTEADDPLSTYRNSTGEVDVSGLRAAVDDFSSGEIDIDMFRAVINAFVST